MTSTSKERKSFFWGKPLSSWIRRLVCHIMGKTHFWCFVQMHWKSQGRGSKSLGCICLLRWGGRLRTQPLGCDVHLGDSYTQGLQETGKVWPSIIKMSYGTGDYFLSQALWTIKTVNCDHRWSQIMFSIHTCICDPALRNSRAIISTCQ